VSVVVVARAVAAVDGDKAWWRG
jgi:hypothetical protein